MTSHCHCLWHHSVYPVFILTAVYSFAMFNKDFGLDNLIYYKLCYNRYKSNMTTVKLLCANNTQTKNLEELQEEASAWSSYVSLIQLLPAFVCNLLLSSYPDKVAHKLPMFLSIFGCLGALAWSVVCSLTQFIEWPMYSLLLGPFIVGVTGSYYLLLISMMAYISLVTHEEKRPFNLVVSQGMIQLGLVSGTLSAGPIIDNSSLTLLFIISTVAAFVALLILTLVMTDLRKPGYDSTKLSDVVNCDRIRGAGISMFRKRRGYHRALLQLSFIPLFLVFAGSTALSSNSYLYFVKQVGMTLTYYSVYNTAILIIRIVMPVLLIPFLRKILQTHLLTNITIGITSSALGMVVLCTSQSLPVVWAAGIVSGAQGLTNAMIHTYQLQIVESDEVGRMFAYVGLLQILVECSAQYLSKTIFSHTLLWWPAFIIALLSLLNVMALVVSAIMGKVDQTHESSVATEESASIINQPSTEPNYGSI